MAIGNLYNSMIAKQQKGTQPVNFDDSRNTNIVLSRLLIASHLLLLLFSHETKKLQSGSKCILVGSCLASGSNHLLLRPSCDHSSGLLGSVSSYMEPTGTVTEEKQYLAPHHVHYNDRYYVSIIRLL